MPNRPFERLLAITLFLLSLCMPAVARAQFGGGAAGGGPQMPGGPEKPRFNEHIYATDALTIGRERGGEVVAGVGVRGNRIVSDYQISRTLQTVKDRPYDYETVLGDVRRLNDMGSFDDVKYSIDKKPEGVYVMFTLRERPTISEVIYHGNQRLNDRELVGRAGIAAKDPLNEFSIESARRRLIDFYHDEGFNSVSIASQVGYEGHPGAVIFRINEGPLERIYDIRIAGSTIVSEARLKKVIKSRAKMGGVLNFGNVADMTKINNDVDVLSAYYHNLGYLTATVGRTIRYDETGTWMTVTFVINEGPRFAINDIIVIGNEYTTEESLRSRLELKPGDMFDGSIMRRDIGEIVYGYGELGFIYCEVEPKTVLREEANTVDLVYDISEGDRWKIGRISVNIDGEPHLMRETTMLNMLEMREGDFIDRRMLEIGRRRIMQSNLLETNPAVAEAPDIKVVPREDIYR